MGDYLLALDPSASRFGYAVFTPDGKLDEAGIIKPRRTKDDANARIDHMVQQADALIVAPETLSWTVVVEDTSGKVNRGRHGGGGAGLPVYGKAVGATIWFLKARSRSVVTVLENEWTRGTRKAVRQQRVAQRHKGYDPAKDKGGDAADAIGLGEWWLSIGRHRAAAV